MHNVKYCTVSVWVFSLWDLLDTFLQRRCVSSDIQRSPKLIHVVL